MRSSLFVPNAAELDPRREGLVIPVRRDCPEVYIPADSVDSVGNVFPGATQVVVGTSDDAFSAAWTEIHSAATYGDAARLLAGASISTGAGRTVNVANPIKTSGGRVRVALGIGASGSEEEIAIASLATYAMASLSTSGADPAANAVAISTVVQTIRLHPRICPSATRLAGKASQASSTGRYSPSVWPIYYDLDQWLGQRLAIDPTLMWYGGYDTRNYITATTNIPTVSSGGPWGSFATVQVNGQDTLDADYLVLGGDHQPIDDSGFFGQNEMVEIHTVMRTGEEDTSANRRTLQSRMGRGKTTLFINGGGGMRLPTPFIAYAGEILRARIANEAGFYTDSRINLELWRIT